jgi:hypothetical protein
VMVTGWGDDAAAMLLSSAKSASLVERDQLGSGKAARLSPIKRVPGGPRIHFAA